MTNELIGNLIGWSIAGVLGLWWLGWLFTRGMAARRKDVARRTGEVSGLTLEDREENRAAFIADLSKPGAGLPGSSMRTAGACATLGAVLVGAGVVVSLVEEGSTGALSGLLLCVGLGLFLLGGAVAIGGGK